MMTPGKPIYDRSRQRPPAPPPPPAKKPATVSKWQPVNADKENAYLLKLCAAGNPVDVQMLTSTDDRFERVRLIEVNIYTVLIITAAGEEVLLFKNGIESIRKLGADQ